ncbi:hypothetical protein [Gracilibacillus lacisalsi]|uniref:hypothetical protein n=1 Tax=Gracilibacillus lacisalsi TaxID=393087 RepID=UPI000366415E|nr:hypothetical protein [Gracilibacillus lacisalsi]
MQLIINENTHLLYKNNIEILDELFQKINEYIEKSDKYFSHLLIDDVEVYEHHDQYIIENIESIEQIAVKMRTKKQFINDLLLSTKSYIDRAVPEIDKLVEEFYDQPTDQTWSNFSRFLEGIQWIIEMITVIDKSDQEVSGLKDYITSVDSLNSELANLLEAIENQDTILIADLIQFEIFPIFEGLDKLISISIDYIGQQDYLS